MKKVFWQFPTSQDMDKWSRLTQPVQKQVEWLFNPTKLTNEAKYDKTTSNFKDTTLQKKQIAQAESQYAFAKKYNVENKRDLNYLLINYVDIKYLQIWSEKFLKQKKREMKERSSYYRIVKQGSVLVYLSFHIFTIFIILLMATMRQSLLSLGYVFILLLKMKDAAEVLNQRSIQQNKKTEEIK